MKKPPGIRKTQIVIEDASTLGGTSKRSDPTALDDDQLDAARARIVATVQEIRAGSYAPTPRHDGYTCISEWGKGCDYAWVCPGRIEEPEDYEAE
jgi:PD-(D/E)XK nuclease superfamily